MELEYLGYVLSPEGRRPSPRLVSAVVNAPKPENIRQLRGFLGLFTFYAQFLPNMSTILHPLNSLTRIGVQYQWDEKCTEAFNAAKQVLVQRG